jgi:predicted RNase H-like HicB family nuclease
LAGPVTEDAVFPLVASPLRIVYFNQRMVRERFDMFLTLFHSGASATCATLVARISRDVLQANESWRPMRQFIVFKTLNEESLETCLTVANEPRALRCVAQNNWPVGSIRLLDSLPGWYSIYVVFSIEIEREDDGRWLAEVPALAGVMCYGADRDEAVARVQALALRVIAERLEHRETPAEFLNVTFQAA